MTAKPSRWLMISLVSLAAVIHYLGRQALSVTAPVRRDEFGVSNTAYSSGRGIQLLRLGGELEHKYGSRSFR
jgi:hypothetical protein